MGTVSNESIFSPLCPCLCVYICALPGYGILCSVTFHIACRCVRVHVSVVPMAQNVGMGPLPANSSCVAAQCVSRFSMQQSVPF